MKNVLSKKIDVPRKILLVIVACFYLYVLYVNPDLVIPGMLLTSLTSVYFFCTQPILDKDKCHRVGILKSNFCLYNTMSLILSVGYFVGFHHVFYQKERVIYLYFLLVSISIAGDFRVTKAE
jgi:hypothetical protein